MMNFFKGLRLSLSSLILGSFAVTMLPPTLAQGQTAPSQIARQSANSQLMIEIEGLKVAKGQTCFSVFESDRGFPSEGDVAVRNECVAITQQNQTLQIQGLKPGNYAVAVLHDLNGDHEANRNALGLPTEGFGFSRNPRIGIRAPQFEDVAIAVKGKQTRIQIRLNYLL